MDLVENIQKYVDRKVYEAAAFALQRRYFN